MVQNAIVTVCFHACHHVSIGCIPDVGVSVSRTKKNFNPQRPDAKLQPLQIIRITLYHEGQFGAHHKICTVSNCIVQSKLLDMIACHEMPLSILSYRTFPAL
jgi:hypothetical protein